MRSIDRILNEAKRKRKYFDQLDNILFLDYDGVVNTDYNNFGQEPFNTDCINNVNRLCKEFNLKVVISSSWRDYPNHLDILYKSGLDKDITVLGSTKQLDKSREDEIIDYLKDHIYIDKFVILDDCEMSILKDYHVKTIFERGFDKDKYIESVKILSKQNS